MNTKDENLAQTLIKGLDVLECIAASDSPLSALDVARRCGISRPTAYRLLITLEEKGYATRDESSTFIVGPSTLKLTRKKLDNYELPEIAKQSLEDLSNSVGETALLSVLAGTDVISIARCESSKTIHIDSKVGSSSPAYCTATGKAILAFQDPSTIKELVSNMDMVPRTKNTITDKQTLLDHLELVRSQGYAIDDHEYDDEMKCISAPIFDMSGKVVAAIGFSGVAFRVEKLDQNQLVQWVVDAAREISLKIGYTPHQHTNK